MEGYFYILKSIKTEKYYIGSTSNLSKRINEHNSGKNISTRNRGPWIIVFSKKYKNIKEARQTEYKIKKFKNKNIIDRIVKEQIIKWAVSSAG